MAKIRRQPDHDEIRGRVHPVRAAFLLIAGIATLLVVAPSVGWADPNEDAATQANRERWQEEYRYLLTETAKLKRQIAEETELYADANRRNYRRGGKRHYHREMVEAAKRDLAELEGKLATFEDDARRGGALRGWLTQVEIEFEEEAQRPSVTSAPEDDGRNPLHLEK